MINLMAKKMLEKVATYYYFFPTYKQGKKILWNGIDKDGFKFMDHIPQDIRTRTDNTEMLIELKNGSIFQIIGTDNVDSIVGTNPYGCIFSEYALQDPIAWGYIRPILAENDGWAIFNYTSRGKNHGYDLLQYAKSKEDWYVNVLSATETGVFTSEQLATEREQYIIEDGDDLRFRQEYLCSFDGSVQGSYYGRQMQEAQDSGRITSVPCDERLRVDTWWDLGVGDATAIWFTQTVGKEIRIIDYLEAEGEGLPYYARALNEKGYLYGDHFAPHDIQVREMGSGISRLETAKALGIKFNVLPRLPIDDGIQELRLFLGRCWFDEVKTKRGVECLRQYHKEFDEKTKSYKNKPKHDWSSHAADAARYLAIGFARFKEHQGAKSKQIRPNIKGMSKKR